MPVCLSSEQVDEGILERVSSAVEVKEECGSEEKSSGFTTESFVTAPVSIITARIKSDKKLYWGQLPCCLCLLHHNHLQYLTARLAQPQDLPPGLFPNHNL